MSEVHGKRRLATMLATKPLPIGHHGIKIVLIQLYIIFKMSETRNKTIISVQINAHYYLHPYFNINAPDNKRFMAEELS